jgi:putative transposase
MIFGVGQRLSHPFRQPVRMRNCLYPTDLSDEQWDILRLALPPMNKTTNRGRPRTDLRQLCSALLYLVRSGCAWRLLPRDFGPWQTVYHYFRLWSRQGSWQTIHDLLRDTVRTQAGRRTAPTAAILDSQTVRSADQAGERGYDKAKAAKGIKRHILVDTLGLLLGVCVGPADVPEREGARRFLSPLLASFRWLRCLWADQGYSGPDFAQWVASHRKTGTLRLEVVPRDTDQRGFVVLAKRWIVERTFGWFMKHRRLVRHYEVRPLHAEAWLHIALIGIMLRRLA